MDEKKSFKAYAIVSASSQHYVSERVKFVISKHGQGVENGIVITPHGTDSIMVFEIPNATSQIVDELSSLAKEYNLYPMYVIQEELALPTNRDDVKWYKVDEVKMRFSMMSEAEFVKFIDAAKQCAKEIYRDDSIFLKIFAYRGESGHVHVMSFNTERSPKYRGDKIGVPEWTDAIYKFVKEMFPRVHTHKVVHYANL